MKKISTTLIICLIFLFSSILIINMNKLKKTKEDVFNDELNMATNLQNVTYKTEKEAKDNFVSENATTNAVEDFNKQIIERFFSVKDVFEKTVELMLTCKANAVFISYDKETSTMLVSVDNEVVSIDDLFDTSAQALILRCFVEMSKVCSEKANILISKQSPKNNCLIYSESVNFMFRVKVNSEYSDYGITYCKNIGDSNYKKIEGNWYWFEFGLV